MQPILRDIRAVAGVTGVAVIVKSDGHIERLFPAQDDAVGLRLVDGTRMEVRFDPLRAERSADLASVPRTYPEPGTPSLLAVVPAAAATEEVAEAATEPPAPSEPETPVPVPVRTDTVALDAAFCRLVPEGDRQCQWTSTHRGHRPTHGQDRSNVAPWRPRH